MSRWVFTVCGALSFNIHHLGQSILALCSRFGTLEAFVRAKHFSMFHFSPLLPYRRVEHIRRLQ